MLLEKAYAKLHGNFESIIAGNSQDALTVLTGAPTQTLFHNDTEDLVSKLQDADMRNFIMTASSQKPKDGLEASAQGIVYSHCYTLIDVYPVTVGERSFRLMKLRNPWGRLEWKGDWSDESALWTDEL